jgi:uncharacterized lipoprotein YddW (UPF0748 family)
MLGTSITCCFAKLGENLMHTPFLLSLLLSLGLTMAQAKPRFEKKIILWMDAHANFERLATLEGIQRVMQKAKDVGFTDIVVDIKPIDGSVLYRSNIAPMLKEWKGYKRAADFDYLATMIQEGRKHGFKVYVTLNVFSEGFAQEKTGIAYTTEQDWATILYTGNGFVPITKAPDQLAIFVNPLLETVQEYELSIIDELVKKYHPDGIILDRARYTGIASDFSDSSRLAFQRHVKKTLRRWPEDIFTLAITSDGSAQSIPGKYYKEWLEWRAGIIHGFFKKVRQRVKSIDKNVDFATYVGAWYPTYYELGVNWASPKYRPEKDYKWASKYYYKTGYAPILDFLCVGTYFYEVNINELTHAQPKSSDRGKAVMKHDKEPWYSVEGSAEVAMKVTKGEIPVYGSLYVQQYKDKENPEQFGRAIRMCLEKTDGLMVFDLVHLENFDWWDVVAKSVR